MYFKDFFSNFDQRIRHYLADNNVKESNTLREIGSNSYLFHRTAVSDSAYIINHDFESFMKTVIGLSIDTFTYLNNTLRELDILLLNPDNKLTFTNENSLNIVKKVKSHEDDIIELTHLKYDINFRITPKGINIHDITGYIKTSPIKIVDNDIDTAFKLAIDCFNLCISQSACVPTESFNAAFFNRVREISFEEIVNAKNNSPNFKYPNKKAIFDDLENDRKTAKYSSHQMNDVLMFPHKSINKFLSIIKSMLSTEVYANFLRAFNFYHNVQSVMNKKYMVTIDFTYRHKLQNVQDWLLTIYFEDSFKLDIGITDNSVVNKNSRHNLFVVESTGKTNKNVGSVFKSNDFALFYDFVFEACSYQLTQIANKPANELVWEDLIVVMMENI